MNIQEVAKLAGISVKALRHYDKIGLLRPARNAENDYRVYGEAELTRLQQLLFFKACGVPLEQIRSILDDPDFEREEALLLQKKALLHEKARIDAMLTTLEKTLAELKGGQTMSQKEYFDGFDFSENPYEAEARQRWGDEAVTRSQTKLDAMSPEEKQGLSQEMEAHFRTLASLRGEAPSSDVVQEAVGAFYAYLNGFGYHYTAEAFAGLGQLYVADARFTKNIDRYGEGLAAFLAEAMGHYAEGLD